MARRDEGPGRGRLLRDGWRAGGLPRVRLAPVRDTRSDPADRLGAGRRRARRGGCLGADLARPAPPRAPAAHALLGLGLLPGVHDRHRPCRARARLQAGEVARPGTGRAERRLAGLADLLLGVVAESLSLLAAGFLR